MRYSCMLSATVGSMWAGSPRASACLLQLTSVQSMTLLQSHSHHEHLDHVLLPNSDHECAATAHAEHPVLVY